MKHLVGILTLIVFLSCNEKSARPAGKRPSLVHKDSNLIKTEPPNPYAAVDVSPMDMSYFPADFPIAKMSGKGPAQPKARIIYSRPHKQGRTIFGSLIKYGEPWRMGANEATEIEFFQPVKIQGQRIEKGRYVMYCIPQEDKWTLVLNTNLFTWGLRPDSTKDIARFVVDVKHLNQSVEYFSIVFEDMAGSADLVVAWNSAVIRLPIQF